MSYFILAWRNIWRNKRRTLITAASIFFALFFALFMRSMQVGSYDTMKKNAVESFAGAIQIHAKGYWADKQIDNSMVLSPDLLKIVAQNDSIKAFSSRIETGLLAAAGNKSKGTLVIGAQLLKERYNLKLDNKLVAGEFPSDSSSDVLVSEGLARYLRLWQGDTIVFMGAGYHGQTAQGLYRIGGILKFPVPDLNNQICFMPMNAAQDLFGIRGKASSIIINVKDLHRASEVADQLRAKADTSEYEVMDWIQLDPALNQQIDSDQASGLMMLYLLYLIVGFGIIGTVIMMTNERRREFGVMIAVGMHKTKLGMILLIEMLYIALLGIVSAVAASLPLLYYMFLHPIPLTGEMAKSMEQYGMEPIMPFALQTDFIADQSITVFVMVMLFALIPIFSISRLKVTDALYR